MADVGLSFSPTNAQNNAQQQQQNPNSASPVQDAIRILSFRLPSVLGASAVTPMQNLGGPSPFGSAIGSSVIQNWLRQLLMGAGGGQQGGSPYGDLFGGDNGGNMPPPPDTGATLPASVTINQPRPSAPPPTSGGGMGGPMPSPFPGPAGGGGGGRTY